ncbi:MAG: hypothetical protein R6X02_11430 [Enhygromyxa sp.]
MTLSRRTWLWTSTAALAAACTRPGPTRVPEAGAEGPRELSRGGAENLIALAELGATIRWLHPSDGAAQVEWEPLLLDGVRGLEGAGTREELVEGLRGLFGEVAPSVVIWRLAHGEEELSARACPDPEAESAGERGGKPSTSGEGSGESSEAETDAAKSQTDADEATASEAESEAKEAESEASEAEAEAGEAEAGEAEAEASEAESEASEAEASEAEASEAEPSEAEPGEAKPSEAEPSEAKPKPSDAEAEPKPAEASEPKPIDQAQDADAEQRPPLPAELFAADEQLPILQWHRRGYAEGVDHELGCARRVLYLPGSDQACPAPATRRRRRAASSCSTCAPPKGRPLAPAAPLQIELPRGLSSMVPLALWVRDGRLAPLDEGAASFGEVEAREYSLDDRATRLLAVLRTWSLLRHFNPHPRADPRALLLPALCTAAEDPSPLVLREALETLLAGFRDGNAALIVETGKAARRFVPRLWLGWVEERVVVTASASEQAQPGDVLTAIDGVSIDSVLAEQLPRTPAASASAAIVRAVARLLEREREGTKIELTLLRTREDGEQHELRAQLRADRRDDRPSIVDLRPAKPLVELAEGVVYLDATRVRRLARAARRLRRASRVIIDLRGELADARGSLLAHFLTEPRVVAIERMPTGPDPAGRLPLELAGERRVEPARARLNAEPVILADARTRGRAELELWGFDQLGASVIGSASAGDLGGVARAWLPGGWQLRFTHSELRGPDGSSLHGVGVRPTIPIEPSCASVRAQEDPLLAAALELARGRLGEP